MFLINWKPQHLVVITARGEWTICGIQSQNHNNCQRLKLHIISFFVQKALAMQAGDVPSPRSQSKYVHLTQRNAESTAY